ncbi:hypothetical protein [Roseovarius phycicola]|uniref:UrcA family protein n=1 Tax=Roseovarius phycicola TaxID=3080976 RepID=A0ABZ2HRV1_9RHOB
MTRFNTFIRKGVILSILTTSLAAPASIATAEEAQEFNPSDLVPRRFSVSKFTQLSDPELYDVLVAVRRGRAITIDGCSVSQSRAIIRSSSKDPEVARRQAITSCS